MKRSTVCQSPEPNDEKTHNIFSALQRKKRVCGIQFCLSEMRKDRDRGETESAAHFLVYINFRTVTCFGVALNRLVSSPRNHHAVESAMIGQAPRFVADARGMRRQGLVEVSVSCRPSLASAFKQRLRRRPYQQLGMKVRLNFDRRCHMRAEDLPPAKT